MSQYALLCLFTCGLPAATMLSAQPAQVGGPEFEVASVRVAVPTSQTDHGGVTHGGPGTDDPGRIQYRAFELRDLILHAYHIPFYRLVIPDSFKGKYFDIVANLPAGTSQEQLELMLQKLLADRFELRVHRQPTSLDTYTMVVAKSGAKLKPTTFTAEEIEKHVIRRDPDGWLFLMPGRISGGPVNGTTVYDTGGGNLEMSDLARYLEIYLRTSVTDATGLTGKYDIKFRASMQPVGLLSPQSSQAPAREASDPAPDLFQALEQQLGLKLEKTKALLDVIVVDSALAVPTEN